MLLSLANKKSFFIIIKEDAYDQIVIDRNVLLSRNERVRKKRK